MKIKFCGIRRPEDVAYMNEFRPDYVGFVFAGTKRRVTPEKAAALARLLDAGIRKVGVFVDEPPENIARAVKLAGLNVVQLHGSETAQGIERLRTLLPEAEIWKAVRVENSGSIPHALGLGADLLLLDSFSVTEQGGTGKTADLNLIRKANLSSPFFLAGGLNSGNIGPIVREFSPYGVDISSGIETGGVKDRRKIEQIMRILRKESGKAVG
ncbi:N-(5'-phosphoribosyl)anthranilate isomerase [Caprobacter fermentans]|uniref:N-(5'-phosphoribosyl)anthranilate isomerase n=1 Tax=Caproicibacter fermentans TaxID=2576756 RepID=A0A6N8HZH3_9FIRM|nr:phosphoribosylanthranilate isomerase [Caproicibacter fermentans]MVB10723.1 N-(5'-phosphoribosyl)anthranilate isomerase [Caproicibacter fermentans]